MKQEKRDRPWYQRMIAQQLPQAEGVNLLVREIIDATDPLTLNALAVGLGLDYNEAKHTAADCEAGRVSLRAKVAKRLKDSGEATSDKAADLAAKDDPKYVAYVASLARLERRRDDLEVLYKIAFQRAELLKGG